MKLNNNDKIVEMLKSDNLKDAGFRLLLKEYGDALYWHIRRIVVGHQDAEDVVQETIINIYRHIDKFKGDSALITWIYRIATNEAVRWLQRQTNFFQSIDSVSPQLSDKLTQECDIDGKQAEVLFQKALLTLPTQQRIAFNMRYYDELSYDEIAKVTGKNINTLKTNYHFAQEKVRNYIKEFAI
ncbi:MAG: RNA polymerase sigma factor [Muribaculaceae bacterium]|nr:RNA polymerase sigma factor [Muribaculaceae bacterium]